MTKDEAAAAYCKTRMPVLPGEVEGMTWQEIDNATRVREYNAVKKGWTQGQKEMVRLAREKAYTTKMPGVMRNGEVIKLSDLEAIKLELSK